MGDWTLNKWQRGLFALASVVLGFAALTSLDGDHDFALVTFLWAVLFFALVLSPRGKPIEGIPE